MDLNFPSSLENYKDSLSTIFYYSYRRWKEHLLQIDPKVYIRLMQMTHLLKKMGQLKCFPDIFGSLNSSSIFWVKFFLSDLYFQACSIFCSVRISQQSITLPSSQKQPASIFISKQMSARVNSTTLQQFWEFLLWPIIFDSKFGWRLFH